MATPSDIWATNAGAGLKDGTSLANAYALADAITAINGLGALTQPLRLRICGDCSVSAGLSLTKVATKAEPIIVLGRNSIDTARQEVVIDGGGGAFSVFTLGTNLDFWMFFDITAQNTDKAVGNSAWDTLAGNAHMTFVRCKGRLAYRGIDVSSCVSSKYIDCLVEQNAENGFQGNKTELVYRCISRNNGGSGFFNLRDPVKCIAHGNSGYGYEGCWNGVSCVAGHNILDGFYSDKDRLRLIDCISVVNGGYGFQGDTNWAFMQRCAYFGNGNGGIVATGGGGNTQEGTIVLPANPFVDSVNGDYTLAQNAAATLLKQQAVTFIDGTHVTYQDIGPLTSEEITQSGIADSVLDELLSNHASSGSLGQVVQTIRDITVVGEGPSITVTPGADVDGVG